MFGCLKNHIGEMAAIIGNTLVKLFEKIFHLCLARWFLISTLIFSFKSLKNRWQFGETLFFEYTQRKQSRGLRSGDCGSHSTSFLKEIRHPRKIFLNIRCSGVALSCWNYTSSDSTQSNFGYKRSVPFNVSVGCHSYY